MGAPQLGRVLAHLRRVLLKQETAELSDSALLNLYLLHRNEAAFETLVRRHGPMVLGVCRRVLRNPHDAEDAFQATLLVLVRKASSLRTPGLVGNWLYGVAYRTALEAKKMAAKRRLKEAKVVPQSPPASTWDDLQTLLDQELDRLPDKYRAVIVLCDLEGMTRKDAARRLGWPEGTVASRLAGARKTLAKRLSRHELALSGGARGTRVSKCYGIPAGCTRGEHDPSGKLVGCGSDTRGIDFRPGRPSDARSVKVHVVYQTQNDNRGVPARRPDFMRHRRAVA